MQGPCNAMQCNAPAMPERKRFFSIDAFPYLFYYDQVYSMFINRSTKNTSELLRVSCDTRWQRADQPVDSRLVILII